MEVWLESCEDEMECCIAELYTYESTPHLEMHPGHPLHPSRGSFSRQSSSHHHGHPFGTPAANLPSAPHPRGHRFRR